jgi:hypothetical protein
MAIFRPLGASTADDGLVWERFDPTDLAVSPWGPQMLHAGPVIGLVGRAMEALAPAADQTRLARLTVDLLGAVGTGPLEVAAWVERPGRRIALLGAEVRQAGPDGVSRPVARAGGWRLRTADTAAVATQVQPRLSPPREGSDALETLTLPESWLTGFVKAIDWQVVVPPGRPEPAVTWARLRVPLVEGDETSDMTTMLTIVDVANGIGAALDPERWTFLNTETTIHLHDRPVGPWVGIEAKSSVGADGIAMSSGALHSVHGPVGRVTQIDLVEGR